MEQPFFDQRAYSQYMDDLNDGQGFYLTPFRDGSAFLGGIRRVECSGEHYLKAERAAKFAVAEHNKKEGETGTLRFRRILNLNLEPAAGAIYYITMVAAGDSGEISQYQLKVWEKINTGYQVQIFRQAPYWLNSSGKLDKSLCCITVDNLMSWMDESYLYYKCFYRYREELLGIEIIHSEQSRSSKGVLWLRSCEGSDKLLNERVGKRMPFTNNFYDFDLISCPRGINHIGNMLQFMSKLVKSG